jgi:hypothetical protein
MRIYKFITIVLSVFIMVSCSPDVLDVDNFNAPSAKDALSNPDDLQGVTSSLVANWFKNIHAYNGVGLGIWVMSDAGTCSWGNAAMKDLSAEPRIAFNNEPGYSYSSTTRETWLAMYATLSQANDVIRAVKSGIEFGEEGADTKMVEAVAYLGQGLAQGYLGLFFDQGYVVNNESDLAKLELESYTALVAASVASLEMAASIAAANNFTLPANWIPGRTYSSADVAKLANTFAARMLVYSSRNATQNTAVDWAKVLSLTNAGIDFDFAPLGDGNAPWAAASVWGSEYHTYAVYGGWGQVDMRVIHMMDPNMPDRWATSGLFADMPNSGRATSNDARLLSDFGYLSSCPFRADRGYYHYSSYRFKRYDAYLVNFDTPIADMLKAENDMLKAEAMVRTNNLAGAIVVINASTRVTRGQLAPILTSATADQILNAIFYERSIELFLTGVGLEFFDMRRRDMLQTGTLLHFPIPGQQLEVLQIPQYSFGGVSNADGLNTSNGGW